MASRITAEAICPDAAGRITTESPEAAGRITAKAPPGDGKPDYGGSGRRILPGIRLKSCGANEKGCPPGRVITP